MRHHARLIAAVVAAVLLVAPGSGATPVENQMAAARGADRLLQIQTANGAFPFQVSPIPTIFENVQGITALGLIEAFKVSADTRFLAGATRTRNWLGSYIAGGPCQAPGDSPPCRIAAPSVYFLTQHALLTGRVADFALARAALQEQLNRFGTGASLVNGIISDRKNNQGLGNLGLWDVAMFIRAAQDLGNTTLADQMVQQLALQSIANPHNSNATYYELGLAGFILGLSEADLAGRMPLWRNAADELIALQAPNGSWPVTFFGDVYGDDTQTTAYAVLALAAVAQILPVQTGADFLRSVQRANGSFAPYLPDDPADLEYGEVNAEAIQALVAATLLVPNGAVAYADAAFAAL
ncbi:MAG: hypothetical protein ACRDJM_11525 [Actinomycetota bacterium]